MGGVAGRYAYLLYLLISILAPAWGASKTWFGTTPAESISILAPAWGASGGLFVLFTNNCYFNSRPRVGGVICPDCGAHLDPISILAPAWGASAVDDQSTAEALFQFSPPRGGRPAALRRGPRARNFNSRPRVGGVLPWRKNLP